MKRKKKGKRELVVKGKEVLEKAHFSDIQHPQKRRWLAALAKTGRIRESERVTKIHARNHYVWLEKDPDYPALVDRAMAIAADFAEGEIFKRAFVGFKKPISYRGKITDWFTEYSDLLSIFWLKGAMPGKYRESLVSFTSTAPSAIQINLGPEPKSEPKSEEKPLPENDREQG